MNFGEAIAAVREQVSLSWLLENERRLGYRPIYTSACAVMAEIYVLGDDAAVRVGGEVMPAELVKAIYRELGDEHMRFVVENFMTVREPVKSVKAYLRTALYNSFYELAPAEANRVRYDFGI